MNQSHWISPTPPYLSMMTTPPLSAPATHPPTPLPTHPPTTDRTRQILAIALGSSLPLIFLILAIMMFMAHMVRWQALQQRALLWGAVLPPGPGPATTLVVTGIAGWQHLLDGVDGEVMEAALGVHNKVIRRLARKHGGYESVVGKWGSCVGRAGGGHEFECGCECEDEGS